jgi:uncharacterized protein with HEPN domain
VNESDRTDRWAEDLGRSLRAARDLVARGRDAFDTDPALPLAFEALCNRVGDLAKKLVAADPARFSDLVWSQAARNRDFVVHHYERINPDLLWTTVAVEFPKLVLPLPTRNLGRAKVDIGDNAAMREILDAEDDPQYRS